MSKFRVVLVVACFALFGVLTAQAQNIDSVLEARSVVDDMLEAFNGRDSDGYYSTFHYPQIMIPPDGSPVIDPRPPAGGWNFDELEERDGWHHSEMESVEMIDSSPTKVHFQVTFTRHREDGSAYMRSRGLWIVTYRNDRWAVQSRSFMPTEALH